MGVECQTRSCICQSKLLLADNVLAYYNENKPLVLVCNASLYGVGALLSHEEPDRQEVQISFVSRTLLMTERNYAQIDKEALAVIFGRKKFHQYLLGCHSVIYRDHKPQLGSCRPAC